MNEQQQIYIKLALFKAAALYRQKGVVITDMPDGIPDVVCQHGKPIDASFAVILPKKTWQELNAEWDAAKD